MNGIKFEKLDREGTIFFTLVLAGKPLSVTQLAKKTGIPHQNVSYHLKKLLDDGLVYQARQNGRLITYSPQEYLKDSRSLAVLWDRFAHFITLLAQEMDFGCVLDEEDDESTFSSKCEDAIFANIQMFTYLFRRDGAIHLDPEKLKEQRF